MMVVVGYVPTPEGRAALDAAIAEAKGRGARLVVVNSRRIKHGLGGAKPVPEDSSELDSVLEGAGVEFEVRQPPHDVEASEALLAVAEEAAADLIVIGLRRRSPVGKLILGSNAQRILLDASCPVLAVKSASA